MDPAGGCPARLGPVARRVVKVWKTAVETHMTKPEISGIAPFFIVKNVPAALLFYRDRLGFDITFQGPEPDDIFFGIVQRGAAMIMFKDVGVKDTDDGLRGFELEDADGYVLFSAVLDHERRRWCARRWLATCPSRDREAAHARRQCGNRCGVAATMLHGPRRT
jgi:hypothetical protein